MKHDAVNLKAQITGKEIAEAREQLGVTQEELGRLFGVSGLTVSRWETGASPPAVPGAVRMALEYLKIDRARGSSDILQILEQKAAEIEKLKAQIERDREENEREMALAGVKAR